MDLVDAIAANTTARSPVELSISSLFRIEKTFAIGTRESFCCLSKVQFNTWIIS